MQVIWRSIWLLATLSILSQIEATNAANILAIFPFASTSHNNVYSTVTKALANKGHHLTVVTPRPIHPPPTNYRQIDVSHITGDYLSTFNVTGNFELLRMLQIFRGNVVDMCRRVMQEEEVKSLAEPKDGTKFDLVLTSSFYNECFYPFAQVHEAPIVLLSPAGPLHNTHEAIGNVVLPSYWVNPILAHGDRMSFKERLLNTLAHVGTFLMTKYYLQRPMEHEMRSAFGEDTPSISELEEYVSLVVLNNHFSLNQARPTVPCLIEAGGLHIKPPKELPKDLKAFLDGADKDGVIYFSLGSILKSSGFPKETRDELVTAFSKVKQRVLWKWEGENPIPGQSKNVRLEKWLPQQDVLAHPNVKLFITHGGLLSFQEAASRGVPLVGIPYYGDQESNMKTVVDLQVGMRVDRGNITSNNILNAINQVLGNPSYSTNMKRIQSIVLDQKDDPLERAVYWIEYVLRHNGAKHLKPAAFYLEWYQICLLDVLFVLVVIPSIVGLGIGLICCKAIKRMCRSRRNTATSTKKTQ